MTAPKNVRTSGKRRDGKAGRAPLATLLDGLDTKRGAPSAAAALDAHLAAGKRLKPPPTRFETREESAGARELRREIRRGRVVPVECHLWSFAPGKTDSE